MFGLGIGANQYAHFIATQLGATIFELTHDTDVDDIIQRNLWLTWECFCAHRIHQGLFSIDNLMTTYMILMRQPVEEDPFNYSIRNAPEGQPMQLYNEIQGLFRPHLSTAFLPEEFTSNIWPVTGKPIKRVEAKQGFGLNFPNALNTIFANYAFEQVDRREIELFAHIVAKAFVDVLFISNDEKRRTRLAMRAAAWEFLPYFPMLLLCRRQL